MPTPISDLRLVRLFLVAIALLIGATRLSAQTQAAKPAALALPSPADSAAIRTTALDYIDGWYTGDAARMERALHPDLAKRIVITDPKLGRSRLQQMSAMGLVQGTKMGGGARTPAEQRKEEVKILDIYNNAASVRIDAGTWIDYLHVAKFNGRWVIVNVLWELTPVE